MDPKQLIIILCLDLPKLTMRQKKLVNNQMKSKNKIVLAYSGGLDTSIILKWLQENYNAEVICYTADVDKKSTEKKLLKMQNNVVSKILLSKI